MPIYIIGIISAQGDTDHEKKSNNIFYLLAEIKLKRRVLFFKHAVIDFNTIGGKLIQESRSQTRWH